MNTATYFPADYSVFATVSRATATDLEEPAAWHPSWNDRIRAAFQPSTLEGSDEGAGLMPISSPFDELAELEGARDVERMTRRFITHLKGPPPQSNLPFAEQLAERLEFLLQEAQAEDPEDPPINAESIRTCLFFLNLVRRILTPEIALAPNGNIIAEWHLSRNQHFGVEFMPGNRTRYVVFAPGDDNGNKVIALSGSAKLEDLWSIVGRYVSTWASSS